MRSIEIFTLEYQITDLESLIDAHNKVIVHMRGGKSLVASLKSLEKRCDKLRTRLRELRASEFEYFRGGWRRN